MPVFYIHIPGSAEDAARLDALLIGLERQFGTETIQVAAVSTDDERLIPILGSLAHHVTGAPAAPAPQPAPVVAKPKAAKAKTARDPVPCKVCGAPTTSRAGCCSKTCYHTNYAREHKAAKNGSGAIHEPDPDPGFGSGVSLVNDGDRPAQLMRMIQSGAGLKGRKL